MGTPLVTKAEYKAYAGLSSTTEDTKIDLLVIKASELVKTICNNSFVDYIDEPAVEIFEGGTSTYVLLEGPPIAVQSVEYSTDYGNTFTALTEFTDWTFSRPTHTIRSIGRDFPYMFNGYRVTYTAGYETLPEDLKLATLDLITYYLRNESAIHSNRAPGGNSVQIEYVTNTKLPAHISRVLDLYTNNYC